MNQEPPRRDRLPNRRQTRVYDLDDPQRPGKTVVATVGYAPSARPAEVFLSEPAHPDSAIGVLLSDAATIISVALQHGVPAAALALSIARLPKTDDQPHARPATAIGAALELLAELSG